MLYRTEGSRGTGIKLLAHKSVGRVVLAVPFLIFFWLIFSSSLMAQMAEGKSDTLRIDSIEIVNNNIFHKDSSRFDFWLYRLANKLHIKTKKYVIKRDLLQQEGDIFSRRLADESERNLRTLRYLWRARIDIYRSGDSLNIMKVTTADNWTLAGGMSISRRADRLTYHFRVEESNLLGTGQSLSFHYYIREFEDNYSQFSFSERRLFGSRLYLDIYIDDSPEVGARGISIGKPFYSLDSRVRYNMYFTAVNRRNDYYSAGSIVATDRIRGEDLVLIGKYRFGSYHNKVTTGLSLGYKDLKVSDITTNQATNYIEFSEDSLFYSVLPEISFFNINYITTKRINAFSITEDINLNKGLKFTFGWALDGRKNRGELYKIAKIEAEFGTYFKSNLLILYLGFNKWFQGDHDFRKTFSGTIRYYNNKLLWYTPVLTVKYSDDLYNDRRTALYLGENNGLRGYPKNYSTGVKRLIINIENRLFSGIEILSTQLGAVQFVDVGRCWRGNRLKMSDLLWSVGAGLRISAEKISGAKMVRLDVAYAGVIRNWQVSFGVNHYF